MNGMRPRLLINKVVSKVLITVYYTPLIVYVYSCVIYNGVKYYSMHITKS